MWPAIAQACDEGEDRKRGREKGKGKRDQQVETRRRKEEKRLGETNSKVPAVSINDSRLDSLTRHICQIDTSDSTVTRRFRGVDSNEGIWKPLEPRIHRGVVEVVLIFDGEDSPGVESGLLVRSRAEKLRMKKEGRRVD